MIFLWFYFMKPWINFLEKCYLCVFYCFHNKYTHLLICENLSSLLCCCFKNLEFSDRQTIQTIQSDFSLSTLFIIFTSCDSKFWVKSLHLKQDVVTISFPVFISFIFGCVFFHVLQCGQYFLNKIPDVF